MRFLVDQPVSWEIAEFLRTLGHDAIHVRDIGMSAAEDALILQRACDDKRAVVTQDTDYGTLVMASSRSRPSIILFRTRDGRPQSQIAILKQILPELQDHIESGSIIVIGDGAIRVRKLS